MQFPLWLVCATAGCAVGMAVLMLTAARTKNPFLAEERGRRGLLARLRTDLDDAGIRLSAEACLVVWVALPLVGAVGASLAGLNPAIVAIVAAALAVLPVIFLRLLVSKSQQQKDAELAKALEQMTSALRTGSSVMRSAAEVSRCRFIDPRVRKAFGTASAAMSLGTPVADAFDALAEELGGRYAKELAVAIGIQHDIGDKEAEIVRSISASIRSEMTLQKEINATLAATSTMVHIMDFMPYIIILILFLMTDYMAVYLSSLPMMLLLVGFLALPAIGAFVNHGILRKIRRNA